MLAKRELVAQLLVRSRLVRPFAAAHNLMHKDFKVLAYHRVLPRQNEHGFPYDLELVSAWDDEFDWQMQYLARHYHVITCKDLAGYIDSGVWPDRPCAMVTFDDGYLDNHAIALPILQRHAIPAVVFVSTDYIGSDRTYWYDELVFDILHTSQSSLPMPNGQDHMELGHTETQRRQAASRLLRFLKSVPNDQRLATCATWREAMNVKSTPDPSSLHRPMNWEQVKALSNAGIEIGSHTLSHPVLTRIGDMEHLEREFADSKAAIEAQIGKPVLSVAYPTGGPGAYSDVVVDWAKKTGYRFGFTYEGGINTRHMFQPHLVRRSAVERYSSRERFQALLAAPDIF